MIVRPDCVPCYYKQAISTMRFAGTDEAVMNDILYEITGIIPTLSLCASPGENSSVVLHRVYELIGNRDPYYKYKVEWNDYIMQRYEVLEGFVDKSGDRLLTAFKIAVAGNIIDMGITPDFDVNIAMGEITSKDFDHNDYEDFCCMLSGASRILVLGDNCGEIVFDKVLVKELIRCGKEVIYVVKGGPILNDATYEDAEHVEMTSLCRVVTTGSNILGISEDYCSGEFLTELRKADIVISKGQANFEALEGNKTFGDKTFFVLRAKCQCVAECLGVKLGEIVLKRGI